MLFRAGILNRGHRLLKGPQRALRGAMSEGINTFLFLKQDLKLHSRGNFLLVSRSGGLQLRKG